MLHKVQRIENNVLYPSIRAIENLPADKRSTIDQKDICKFKYYQDWLKISRNLNLFQKLSKFWNSKQ